VDIRTGFDHLPHALIGLLEGENTGTLIVQSAEPDEGRSK
jgi:NADPH-dependent curcumin reductase CurA